MRLLRAIRRQDDAVRYAGRQKLRTVAAVRGQQGKEGLDQFGGSLRLLIAIGYEQHRPPRLPREMRCGTSGRRHASNTGGATRGLTISTERKLLSVESGDFVG